MRSPTPSSAVLLAGCAAALALRCGGGNVVAPPVGVSGRYVLKTVNGAPLPARVPSSILPPSVGPVDSVQLTSDVYTFDGNGTYAEENWFRVWVPAVGPGLPPGPDNAFGRSKGTWTLTGTTLVLKDAQGGSQTATLSGDSAFVLTVFGAPGVYRR